jgi:peroxiredoxin
MRNLFFFIFFIFTSPIIAATNVINGVAPDYAGVTIDLMTYSNQISYSEKKISSCKVSADGSFSFTVEASQPTMIFAHTGVYLVYLFIEPGAKYTVQLPPRLEKKPEEKLNPYFEEKQVHLIVKECIKNNNPVSLQNELNFYIRSFDDYYGPYMAKYAFNVASQRQEADRDSSIIKIKALFADNENQFYNDYKNYKIGFLQFMSLQNKSRAISSLYFSNKPILYNNPAYTELFNQVFDKYFLYFGRTSKGKAIYDDINSMRSYSKLKNTLSGNDVLQNDSLKELVILKGLYDGFYAVDFSRGALLTVLDSLIASTKIDIHKQIGFEIREKVTKLLTGYYPPSFKLYDQNDKLRSLDDFKGKYTYIMFCTTQNYACITEFEQLKKLYEKHADKLNIITILADDNFSESKKFISGKQLPWTFLHYGNTPEVLKEYDVRALPTYFLLDKEGKMAISPAPSPSENFEMSFFNELRSKGIL